MAFSVFKIEKNTNFSSFNAIGVISIQQQHQKIKCYQKLHQNVNLWIFVRAQNKQSEPNQKFQTTSAKESKRNYHKQRKTETDENHNS